MTQSKNDSPMPDSLYSGLIFPLIAASIVCVFFSWMSHVSESNAKPITNILNHVYLFACLMTPAVSGVFLAVFIHSLGQAFYPFLTLVAGISIYAFWEVLIEHFSQFSIYDESSMESVVAYPKWFIEWIHYPISIVFSILFLYMVWRSVSDKRTM